MSEGNNLKPEEKNGLRICPHCGKAFQPWNAKHRFCSRECYRQHTQEQGEPPIPEEFRCPYNDRRACQERRCGVCGWNPVVARRRTERLLGKSRT